MFEIQLPIIVSTSDNGEGITYEHGETISFGFDGYQSSSPFVGGGGSGGGGGAGDTWTGPDPPIFPDQPPLSPCGIDDYHNGITIGYTSMFLSPIYIGEDGYKGISTTLPYSTVIFSFSWTGSGFHRFEVNEGTTSGCSQLYWFFNDVHYSYSEFNFTSSYQLRNDYSFGNIIWYDEATSLSYFFTQLDLNTATSQTFVYFSDVLSETTHEVAGITTLESKVSSTIYASTDLGTAVSYTFVSTEIDYYSTSDTIVEEQIQFVSQKTLAGSYGQEIHADTLYIAEPGERLWFYSQNEPLENYYNYSDVYSTIDSTLILYSSTEDEFDIGTKDYLTLDINNTSAYLTDFTQYKTISFSTSNGTQEGLTIASEQKFSHTYGGYTTQVIPSDPSEGTSFVSYWNERTISTIETFKEKITLVDPTIAFHYSTISYTLNFNYQTISIPFLTFWNDHDGVEIRDYTTAYTYQTQALTRLVPHPYLNINQVTVNIPASSGTGKVNWKFKLSNGPGGLSQYGGQNDALILESGYTAGVQAPPYIDAADSVGEGFDANPPITLPGKIFRIAFVGNNVTVPVFIGGEENYTLIDSESNRTSIINQSLNSFIVTIQEVQGDETISSSSVHEVFITGEESARKILPAVFFGNGAVIGGGRGSYSSCYNTLYCGGAFEVYDKDGRYTTVFTDQIFSQEMNQVSFIRGLPVVSFSGDGYNLTAF